MSHLDLLVTASPFPAADYGTVQAGVCDMPGLSSAPPCIGKTLVGDAVSGAAGSAIREMAQAVVGAAKDVMAAVVTFLSAPTHPDLQQDWFASSLDRIISASALFAALFFILGIGRAVLHSSLSELGRVVGFTVGAFAGSTVALSLVQAFVAFTDAATQQVSAGTRTDMASTFSALLAPLGPMTTTTPGQAVLAVVLGVLIALGTLAVYLELFVRNVMIHVVAYFVPLMLMGAIWGPTRRWAKRGMEFLGVLIVSKFVLFSVIALGWSAVSSFRDEQLSTSWASVLTGVVLVAVAAWLPWLLFKLLPFMETHVRSAMTRQDARAGVSAPMNAAAGPMRAVESNLRRAAGLAMAVSGGPAGAAAAGAGAAGGGSVGIAGGLGAGRAVGGGQAAAALGGGAAQTSPRESAATGSGPSAALSGGDTRAREGARSPANQAPPGPRQPTNVGGERR